MIVIHRALIRFSCLTILIVIFIKYNLATRCASQVTPVLTMYHLAHYVLSAPTPLTKSIEIVAMVTRRRMILTTSFEECEGGS